MAKKRSRQRRAATEDTVFVSAKQLRERIRFLLDHPFVDFLPFPTSLESVRLTLRAGQWKATASADPELGTWEWDELPKTVNAERLKIQYRVLTAELQALRQQLCDPAGGRADHGFLTTRREAIGGRLRQTGSERERPYQDPAWVEVIKAVIDRTNWIRRLYLQEEFVTFQGCPVEYPETLLEGRFPPAGLALRILTVREGLRFDLAEQTDDEALYIRSLIYSRKHK